MLVKFRRNTKPMLAFSPTPCKAGQDVRSPRARVDVSYFPNLTGVR